MAKAVTLNDEEIARLSRESVEWMDATIRGRDSTTYGARLKRSPKVSPTPDGLPLNFKVYLVTDVKRLCLRRRFRSASSPL